MHPSRTARAPGPAPSAAPSRTRMGRSRLPPASATCSPRSRTSWTGRVGQLAVDLRLAGPERVADHELESRSRSDALQAEAHGARLVDGCHGHPHRSADDGERQRGAAGELGVRVRLERPVLPPQHEAGESSAERRSGDPQEHAVAFAPVPAAERHRVGPAARREVAVRARPRAGSGRRGGPSRPPRGTAAARAGGSGCSNGAATTGTPAPASRAGRASDSSASGRDRRRRRAGSRAPASPCCARRRPRAGARRPRPRLARTISTSVHAARPVGRAHRAQRRTARGRRAASPRARAPRGSASGRGPGAGSPRAARRRRSGRRPRRRWPLAMRGSRTSPPPGAAG